MARRIGIPGSIVIALAILAAIAGADQDIKADKVLVIKSARKLYLLKAGDVIKSYTISLGSQPRGPKMQLGDKKTPEGIYRLDGRNSGSKYYKSILISYPIADDLKQAKQMGVDPGGGIALHGLPVSSDDEAWDYIERDWTDGCIAVTNEEMQEIWDLVDDPTPIVILP